MLRWASYPGLPGWKRQKVVDYNIRDWSHVSTSNGMLVVKGPGDREGKQDFLYSLLIVKSCCHLEFGMEKVTSDF